MSSCETIKIPKQYKKISLADFVDAGRAVSGVIRDGAGSGKKTQTLLEPLGVSHEKAVHDAYQQGLEEGNRRATELLQSEYIRRTELEEGKINEVLKKAELHLRELSPRIENALLQFVVGVAEQIVRQEIKTDQTIVLNTIKEGIKNISGVEKITIRINPAHKVIVQKSKPSIQSISESLRDIRIETDDTVEPGGCIIESDIGTIDARIATQLDQVKKIIAANQ